MSAFVAEPLRIAAAAPWSPEVALRRAAPKEIPAPPGDATRPFAVVPCPPDAISMLFQPVFSVGSGGTALHAVEALARGILWVAERREPLGVLEGASLWAVLEGAAQRFAHQKASVQ